MYFLNEIIMNKSLFFSFGSLFLLINKQTISKYFWVGVYQCRRAYKNKPWGILQVTWFQVLHKDLNWRVGIGNERRRWVDAREINKDKEALQW